MWQRTPPLPPAWPPRPMLRAGLARAAAAARRAAQSGTQADRPLHSAATAAAATLGWPAALVGGAAAATAWATLDEGDTASGLRRVAVATRHLVPVLADWKAHELRVALQGMDEAAAQADASATHTRIAERMRDLALVNGGIYVKGGQHICAQPIIPAEYVAVLRVLMSHAQRHPLADDERTFQEDTGAALRDAFAEFDTQPVASASLAQVYRAKLHDGTAVAVKIQQRPVARFLAVDLATIESFYALLAALIPGLRLGWLAEETRRHMQEELDFVAEAANARRVAALLAAEFPRDKVLVPATHAALCGPRVLVMDWVDGVRIDDAPGLARLRADVPAIAARLQRVFGAMTFVHGFVHCDPHPGNLLVTPSGALAILDHGIYRQLSDPLRRGYAALWLAVLAGDRSAIRASTAALGMDPEQWRFVTIMLAMAPGYTPEDGDAPPKRNLLDGDGGARVLAQMSNEDRVAATQRVLALTGGVAAQSAFFESIPRDLLLILKTNNLLRYVNDQLGTPVNRFRIIADYARNGLRVGGAPASGALPQLGFWASLRVRVNTALAPTLLRVARWLFPLPDSAALAPPDK